MVDDYQLNPDDLLKAVQEEENRQIGGKLKIFFGMCAGVGKTYSMLEEAHQKLKEGIDIVIGTVNTHGRKETENLLKGLPLIPEKWISYRDHAFQELDLETILQINPDIVLIDELAHTNVPGSKHSKRWQDVVEILNAGIHVYTTLNVQHIESRKSIVENITGVEIQETVPDSILDRADAIALIDIPPKELLTRVKEGKVYLGDHSKIAIENFFQEENLILLRKISLRFTSEKVDHDLHSILSEKKGWPTREKLLVAISPSPYSQRLIQETRQRAFELDAPWVAIYVDQGSSLASEDQKQLTANTNLVRDLGAEVIKTYDNDIAHGIQRVARQQNVTQILVGRSPKKNIFTYFRKTLLEKLEEDNKGLDIIVIRENKIANTSRTYQYLHKSKKLLREYIFVFAFCSLMTFINYLLTPLTGYKPIGFVFLLSILGLSFFVRRGPILLAAILSALSWDVLFIPPIFQLSVTDPEDIILLTMYFITAAICGTLASQFREKDYLLNLREGKAQRLLTIQKEIINSLNFESLRENLIPILEEMFPGKFDILSSNVEDQLAFTYSLPILNSEKEQATAMWVFQQGKMAGRFTDTLPLSAATYFPIKSLNSNVGVFINQRSSDHPLSQDEINDFQTICEFIGTFLVHYSSIAKTQAQNYTMQIEKLHSAILHSVSKSFYIPLERLFETLEVLQDMLITGKKVDIEKVIKDVNAIRIYLRHIVDNILAIAEIESGFLTLSIKKENISQLIKSGINEILPCANGRKIVFLGGESKMHVNCDYGLIKLAIRNLLLNAIENSPTDSSILVELKFYENIFSISILDEGPGISSELISHVFEKFYRIPRSQPMGIGLGLAIVKSIVEIHQGSIKINSRKSKGMEFSIIFPLS